MTLLRLSRISNSDKAYNKKNALPFCAEEHFLFVVYQVAYPDSRAYHKEAYDYLYDFGEGYNRKHWMYIHFSEMRDDKGTGNHYHPCECEIEQESQSCFAAASQGEVAGVSVRPEGHCYSLNDYHIA